MDWFNIKFLSSAYYDTELYFLVGDDIKVGTYKDFPSATHYATRETVF